MCIVTQKRTDHSLLCAVVLACSRRATNDMHNKKKLERKKNMQLTTLHAVSESVTMNVAHIV